jgi:hypothetical protein
MLVSGVVKGREPIPYLPMPLPMVEVYVADVGGQQSHHQIGTTTDSAGKYTIDVPAGYFVAFSHISYQMAVEPAQPNINVTLERAVYDLGPGAGVSADKPKTENKEVKRLPVLPIIAGGILLLILSFFIFKKQ